MRLKSSRKKASSSTYLIPRFSPFLGPFWSFLDPDVDPLHGQRIHYGSKTLVLESPNDALLKFTWNRCQNRRLTWVEVKRNFTYITINPPYNCPFKESQINVKIKTKFFINLAFV
jgi:hypothetical protein